MDVTSEALARRRRDVAIHGRKLLQLFLAATLLIAGCGGPAEPEEQGVGVAIRVGAFDFPESELLAELYAQALERRGLPVQRLGRIGSREVVEPALELGLIDVVPEYAGTMLSFVSLGSNEPTSDSELTVADLRSVLAPRGMIALEPAAAQNRNAVVVSKAFAVEHGVSTVSDLAPLAGALAFGGPSECPERYFCLVGLRDRYGIEFGVFIPIPNATVVAASLRADEIDVGLLFSTDSVLVDPDLVVLGDDLDLQPAENIVPVVRSQVVEKWGPALIEALDAVSVRLDTTSLVLLNSRAADATPAIAADEWWTDS
jgi:osmoprotectant transport system substrate-binding protein